MSVWPHARRFFETYSEDKGLFTMTSMTTTNVQKAHGGAGPTKTSYKIAVIGGDGTGPEVVREGLKVLKPRRENTSSSSNS